MNIKKIGGSLAVALSMLALNGVVMADCDVGTISTDIKDQATALRCDGLGGSYKGAPIWQYKGDGDKGCVVHEKLAKLLWEVRDGSTPPPIKNGNNLAKGAANDMDDGKFQSAIDQLQRFWDTIEYEAVLNRKNIGASDAAEAQQLWAVGVQTEIAACL